MTAFTSHGAVITVALEDGEPRRVLRAHDVCSARPPPARARDVLKRGRPPDLRLVTVDAERRIAELALL